MQNSQYGIFRILKRNSRLSLALHTLAHMSDNPERIITSAEIAEHIGTNPVVVRRVLGSLRDAGLLNSERGQAGGWSLSQPPGQVTLADVYCALDDRLIVHGDKCSSTACSTERALEKKVAYILQEVEHNLLQKLASIPISKVNDS